MRNTRRSVSVIIPTYNAEKTITRCLTSVLHQSHPVDEIIVVDDCSTDQTLATITELIVTEPRLKGVLRLSSLPLNSGPGAARNKGILQASAEFIALIDADDFWMSHHIETAFDAFASSGESCCTVVHRPLDAPVTPGSTSKYRPFSVLRYLFIQANCSTITLLAPKALIIRAGLFPTNRNYSEDFEFFINLFLMSKKRICVDEPRSAVIGKHAFAASIGLSSNLNRMYIGTIQALASSLMRTPYISILPLLVLWHTVKFCRRLIITFKIKLSQSFTDSPGMT